MSKPIRDDGPWIQTFTNKVFHVFAPQVDQVCIEDIAHALAHVCRFGGHTRRFYSVAEHCVVMSRVVGAEGLALEALLHDAPEAYLGDMVRPLKLRMETYRDVEADVAVVIAKKFQLPLRLNPVIKELDLRMLMTERAQLLSARTDWDVDEMGYTPLPFTLECLPPPLAKQQFLQRYREIVPN